MTPEQMKEHDDYVEMFATEGWRFLMKSMEELRGDIMDGSISGAPSNDQWQFLRGQVSQLISVIGFEQYITTAYAAALEEEGELEVSDLEK